MKVSVNLVFLKIYESHDRLYISKNINKYTYVVNGIKAYTPSAARWMLNLWWISSVQGTAAPPRGVNPSFGDDPERLDYLLCPY